MSKTSKKGIANEIATTVLVHWYQHRQLLTCFKNHSADVKNMIPPFWCFGVRVTLWRTTVAKSQFGAVAKSQFALQGSSFQKASAPAEALETRPSTCCTLASRQPGAGQRGGAQMQGLPRTGCCSEGTFPRCATWFEGLGLKLWALGFGFWVLGFEF